MHPYNRFLKFKRENDGKYDIPENYDKLSLWRKNIEDMSQELNNNYLSDKTLEKVNNRLQEIGVLDKHNPDDVVPIYQRIAKSSDPLDILS